MPTPNTLAVVPPSVPETPAAILEQVLAEGDLERLTNEQRVTYIMNLCRSLGINPLTRPFQYIKLSGKLTLYATKGATDQIRNARKVSISKLERRLEDGIYIVTAHARTQDGVEDVDEAAVSVQGLQGENLSNAMMKCTTKAKRRVTLSICGLNMMDETEVDSVPAAIRRTTDDQATYTVIHEIAPESTIDLDTNTGEIIDLNEGQDDLNSFEQSIIACLDNEDQIEAKKCWVAHLAQAIELRDADMFATLIHHARHEAAAKAVQNEAQKLGLNGSTVLKAMNRRTTH